MLEYIINFHNVSYWAFIGTMMLGFMTYQDYKNNRKIDDRFNFMMMGVTISLFSHIPTTFIKVLLLLAIVILFRIYAKKYIKLGDADLSALSWSIYGFGIIGLGPLAVYFILFGIFALLYHGVKLGFFKYKAPTPFMPMILLPFLMTNIIIGVY